MLDKLANLRHTHDLLTYTTEFQTIVNKLLLDEKTQLLFYVRGLKSKTKAEVRCKEPTTLIEAMDLAALYEGTIWHEHKVRERPYQKPYHQNNRREYQNAQVNYVAKEETKERLVSKSKLRWSTDGRPICVRCGKTGHIGKDCRSKPRGGKDAQINLVEAKADATNTNSKN